MEPGQLSLGTAKDSNMNQALDGGAMTEDNAQNADLEETQQSPKCTLSIPGMPNKQVEKTMLSTVLQPLIPVAKVGPGLLHCLCTGD